MTLNLIKKLNISKAQNRSQIVNYSRSINGIYTFLQNFILKKCWEKELEIELNRSQRALKTEWIVMNGFCIDVGNRSMYDASNTQHIQTSQKAIQWMRL